jgi:hypothetical protein
MQVVGDYHRHKSDEGQILCLKCHHDAVTKGLSNPKLTDAQLQDFERIQSQEPASLHCGWEVTSSRKLCHAWMQSLQRFLLSESHLSQRNSFSCVQAQPLQGLLSFKYGVRGVANKACVTGRLGFLLQPGQHQQPGRSDHPQGVHAGPGQECTSAADRHHPPVARHQHICRTGHCATQERC